MDVRCHGTYAWGLGDRVKTLGKIGKQEAAARLRIPSELRDEQYMWLNKGWIVEERAYRIRDTWIGDGERCDYVGNDVRVGEHIVFLADGNYYRLEVVS